MRKKLACFMMGVALSWVDSEFLSESSKGNSLGSRGI